jgi:hypothetical protein
MGTSLQLNVGVITGRGRDGCRRARVRDVPKVRCFTAATERLSEIIRFAFAVVAWGLTALLIGLNTTLWLDMLWPRTREEPSYAFRP